MRRESCTAKLVLDVAIARCPFPGWMSSVPVVRARAFMCAPMLLEGRVSTNCLVRMRLVVVWESRARPSMQRWPRNQAEDMMVEFSFSVEIITTMLPQQRIAGDMVLCLAFWRGFFRAVLSDGLQFG